MNMRFKFTIMTTQHLFNCGSLRLRNIFSSLVFNSTPSCTGNDIFNWQPPQHHVWETLITIPSD